MSFEVVVKPVLPMSRCSKAFRSCYSELGQATVQLPMAADTIPGCSGVCLPDLISHQKELTVRQLKIDHHPKQGSFCQPQNKRRTGPSLQKAVNECTLTTQKRWQMGPGGAWWRYYHVFKEGELAELIERHIPELHITHSYFDCANWCVIAEKTEVWRILGKFCYGNAQRILRGFLPLESLAPLKIFPEAFYSLVCFGGEEDV